MAVKGYVNYHETDTKNKIRTLEKEQPCAGLQITPHEICTMKKLFYVLPFLGFFFFNIANAAVYTQSVSSINYSAQNTVTITASSSFASSSYFLFLNATGSSVSGNGLGFSNGAYSWNQIYPSQPFATGTYTIVGSELHGSTTVSGINYDCGMGVSYSSCLSNLSNAAYNDGIHYNTSTIQITADTPTSSATSTLASTTYFFWGGTAFVSTKETIKMSASDTIELYYDPFKVFWVFMVILFAFIWGVYKISCMVRDY